MPSRSKSQQPLGVLVPLIVAAVLALIAAGCGEGAAVQPAGEAGAATVAALPTGGFLGDPLSRPSEHGSDTVPSGLVSLAFGPESLEFWPYTGISFDGSPRDPVNLVFMGQADPLRIRAALVALDGDRSAFGYPDEYPFNARWSDAIGEVQTSYASGSGWSGSVIQLQLGVYDPIRFHLRIFRTGNPSGGGGTWTVAAAHMDLLIPGTADHQVISWSRAREIVIADMLRSGLLDPGFPVVPSGPFTQTPGFREIDPAIYNELPDDLIAFIGGPAKPVSGPVPISNDGMTFLLNVKESAPIVPGTFTEIRTMMYDQVIPKPFCTGAAPEYVYLSGPVDFDLAVTVSAKGDYTVRSAYHGVLSIVPMDVSVFPPVPGGDPFSAEVEGMQHVNLRGDNCIIDSRDRRVAPQQGGTEILSTHLRVAGNGSDRFQLLLHCLDDLP